MSRVQSGICAKSLSFQGVGNVVASSAVTRSSAVRQFWDLIFLRIYSIHYHFILFHYCGTLKLFLLGSCSFVVVLLYFVSIIIISVLLESFLLEQYTIRILRASGSYV